MDRGAAEIRVSSRLDADPAAVWERVTTPAGINYEMRPIMGCRYPRESTPSASALTEAAPEDTIARNQTHHTFITAC